MNVQTTTLDAHIVEENTFSHKYGVYFPTGFIWAAWLVTLAGAAGILMGGFAALVFPVGFLVQFTTSGIQVDFGSRQYREYIALFGKKMGTWKTLPEIDYVSAFRAKTSTIVNSRVSHFKNEDFSYEVNLIVPPRTRLNVAEYDRGRCLENGKTVCFQV